jgi:hypothetical protein
VKTLYTGHATIGTHSVYSFIYADTLLEAEGHLTKLLTHYLREHHSPSLRVLPAVRVVSRPEGWDPPDGYYLPGTSAQYALRYPTHRQSSVAQRSGTVQQSGQLLQPDLPQQPAFPSSNIASH